MKHESLSPMYRDLVRRWIYDEPGMWQKMRKATDADLFAVAMPRVLAVVAGEVKWSEASPGDRAIWNGRARDPERARTNIISYANMYDTILIVPRGDLWMKNSRDYNPKNCWNVMESGTTHCMFGNANVGNFYLTNMQVAGQLCFDRGFLPRVMYASASRTLDTSDDGIFIEAVVGCAPVRHLPLREWLSGITCHDFTIPNRQNFQVRVSATNIAQPLELVVHIEGDLGRVERDNHGLHLG